MMTKTKSKKTKIIKLTKPQLKIYRFLKKDFDEYITITKITYDASVKAKQDIMKKYILICADELKIPADKGWEFNEKKEAFVQKSSSKRNPDLTIPLLIGTTTGIASGLTVLGIDRAIKQNPSEEMCMVYRKIKQRFPDLDYKTFHEAYNKAIKENNPSEAHERYESFHGVPVDKVFKGNIPDPVGELTPISEIDVIVYECAGKKSVGDEGEDISYVHTWEKNKMILAKDEVKNFFIGGKCRVLKNGINDYKGKPTWDLDNFKFRIPKKVTYLGILPEIKAGGKVYRFIDTILCTDAKGQYLYITELMKGQPTHPKR